MITKSDSNISFSGLLYGKIGNHLTKPINCCVHGDGKFVKFIGHLGETSSNIKDSIKVSCTTNGLNKIIVETKEIPKLSLWENLFYRVDRAQSKAMKWRKEGRIQSFVFQLNEIEYKTLKNEYLYITKKQLNKFVSAIKSAAPEEMQGFLKKFFN